MTLNKDSPSIYECWQNMRLMAYCGTERGALEWLSSHGGGLYKNSLHRYQFAVKANEFKNLV